MNELRIESLHLHNFKGVRDFTLEPAGYSASVFGDNASGKTTIVDAWSWLLNGKDAEGRADFEIKELDADGEPAHYLDHEVEAVLINGDVKLTLRKVYRELWTQKRGAPDKTFSGHTTDHFVDGVPLATKAEYDAVVAELADIDVFQALTDPEYVAAAMHWQKRRELLIEVGGDVTTDDVIDSQEGLEEVRAILGERCLEDQRKVLVATRKSLSDDRETIPTRIEEATRALPDVDEGEDTLRARLKDLQTQRGEAEEKRAAITVGGAAAEKKVRIKEIDAEILGLRNQLEATRGEAGKDLKAKLAEARGEANRAKTAAERISEELAGKQKTIDLLQTQMDERRTRWNARDAEQFEHAADDTCSACGQAIPEWKLTEARDKAEGDFNLRKSRDLAEISDEGKQLKERSDTVVAALPALEAQRTELRAAQEAAQGEIPTLEEAIAQAERTVPTLEDNADYQKLAEETLRLEGEVSDIQGTVRREADAAKTVVNGLDEEVRKAQAMLARHDARKSGLARIENLKAEEERLSEELEKVQQHLFLLEAFVRARAALANERINRCFEVARFKLFAEQVDGGLTECCEVTCGGVPWRSLNHGDRVRVGLDIIRTLQRHHGFAPPIFIDRGESVTSLPAMDCQMIRLVVSEPDKTLRVETAQALMEATA